MRKKRTMLCPLCKAELIVKGQALLVTLDEHICAPNDEVCLKDRYVCSNESCTSHLHGICWNEDGENYGCSALPTATQNWYHPYFMFMENNPAPFGSWWRKMHMESKRDGDEYNVLPWLTEKMGFRIVANKWRRYDDDCVLLDFGTRFSIQTRQGNCCGTPHYGINGWHMFWFSIGRYFNERMGNKDFELKYCEYLDEKNWWRSWSYNVKYFIEKYWYKSDPDYKEERANAEKEKSKVEWNVYYTIGEKCKNDKE